MTENDVLTVLREIVDPELGINIVDLGLVYRVVLDRNEVAVEMTMTSPACPMGQMLQEQSRAAIEQKMPGLRSVQVDLVWFPPWHSGLMSAQAREQLGWSA